MSSYFFRDDLQAEKDRLAGAQPGAGASGDNGTSTPSSSATGAPPAAPASSPDSAAIDAAGKAATEAFSQPTPVTTAAQPTTPAPAPTPTDSNAPPDYFADFRSSLDAQDPVKAQLQQAADAGLNSKGESFDPIATAARDRLGRETAVAGEEARQNAVKTFGSDTTGQAGRAEGDFTKNAIDQQSALETQLAGQKAASIASDKNQGLNALNSLLSSMDSATKLQAQFALSKADQAFQQQMQQSGFVQQKDLQTMQSDLQKELQQRGFTEEQAIQLSQQSFAALTQQRDEDFQQKIQTLQNAFTSGERVSSQDFQLILQSTQAKAAESLATLQHTLNMDQVTTEETFQKSMQMSQNDFAAYLQTQGFDHDTATAAAAQAATAKEDALNRASTELTATAQLAQQDKQFQAQLGLSQQELDQKQQELTATLKQMGVQTDSAEMQNLMQLVSVGIEMGNGDPAAIAPFAKLLANGVQKYATDHGITIDTSSLTGTAATGTSSTTKTGSSVTTSAGGTGWYTPTPVPAGTSAADAASLAQMDAKYSTLTPGVQPPAATEISGNSSGESVSNASDWLDANVGSLPQSVTNNQDKIDAVLNAIATGSPPPGAGLDTTTFNKNSQKVKDAQYYVQALTGYGLSLAEAYTLLSMVAGKDRANAAAH